MLACIELAEMLRAGLSFFTFHLSPFSLSPFAPLREIFSPSFPSQPVAPEAWRRRIYSQLALHSLARWRVHSRFLFFAFSAPTPATLRVAMRAGLLRLFPLILHRQLWVRLPTHSSPLQTK